MVRGDSYICVAWNGPQSQYFLAINGVKQGGVLGLIMYTDWLLVKLLNAGVVCFLFVFFSLDLLIMRMINVLLAPTPTEVIVICDEHGKEFSIKFNAIKSK